MGSDQAARVEEDELRLDQCSDLDFVTVNTRNSVYEAFVLSAATGEVMIRGGRHFPEFVRGRIFGSSFGGSSVRMRRISVDLHLEIQIDGERWTTSRICSVSRVPVTSMAGAA